MSEARTVRLFRNGRNQAVRIPVEFELPGSEAVMRKEGDRLVIEPKEKPGRSFLDVIKEYGPLDSQEWPDIDDDDLLPLDDVEL
ncbi:MAG TPA: AbrB/MazE/SpoVT family DNA-binding domain-containing protein [Devosiaceae bacterium]|nr:AbrB/MazE/SpoVT family DNA-binding domain-containing protein [Devosiaceae bacterium]